MTIAGSDSINTTYGLRDIQQFMADTLSQFQDTSKALGWKIENHDFRAPAENAVLWMQYNGIDSSQTLSPVQNLRLRAICRMCLWQAVSDRTIAYHDSISTGNGSFSGQKGTHERAKALYEAAKKEVERLDIKNLIPAVITVI